MPESTLLHATCVAVAGEGLLILGSPGAGKSDLALRLIDQPGQGTSGRMRASVLVADDQVLVRRDGNRLVASPPGALAGKLEVRGLGIVDLAHLPEVVLRLALRLAGPGDIERLPDFAASRYELLGLGLPLALLDPATPSAPARVRAALDWIGAN